MKYLLSALVIFIVGEEPPTKTVKEYKDILKSVKYSVENITNKDYYKHFKFIEKSTKLEKDFAKVEEYQQDVIMIMQLEILSSGLTQLYNDFLAEQGKFDTNSPPEVVKLEDEPAGKGNVDIFVKELFNYRKVLAVKYEKFILDFFKKNNKRFLKKEVDFYIKGMKQFHDKHRLIERN